MWFEASLLAALEPVMLAILNYYLPPDFSNSELILINVSQRINSRENDN